MLGGGAEPSVFGASDSSAITAGRLRVSLRAVKGNNTELSGTFAFGVASWETDEHDTHCIEDPEDSNQSDPTAPTLPECDTASFFEPSVSRTRAGVDLSVALELGARTHVRFLEIGAVVRIDAAPGVALLTLGPTLGVAF
jgi:hypothetical protein